MPVGKSVSLRLSVSLFLYAYRQICFFTPIGKSVSLRLSVFLYTNWYFCFFTPITSPYLHVYREVCFFTPPRKFVSLRLSVSCFVRTVSGAISIVLVGLLPRLDSEVAVFRSRCEC